MVQYEADKGSILRFYSTSSSQSGWWNGREGGGYNSPERRARLLRLIRQYEDQLQQMDFARMNVNGQVDYILFLRNLRNEAYQLQQEEDIYKRVASLFPFEDSIWKARRTPPPGLFGKRGADSPPAQSYSSINRNSTYPSQISAIHG